MKYNIDELFDIATRTFIGLGYDVTEGSNSKTDYGHSRYFYVNQDNKADVNSGLGFQVRVSDHSTGDRRILNGEQFIFDNNDVMEVFNRINYWFHPEEYKNVVVVKTKVVQIEVGENDLQPSDEIISERVAKSGNKRYTIKRTYKNEGIVPTHKFSGYKLPFKPNNPDIRFAEGGRVQKIIENGSVELKVYDTTPEHAKEYGLIAYNPLYIQRIFVNENDRNKGLGKEILQYLDKYAEDNGNDLIFGHIQQKANPSRVKSLLEKNDYTTIVGNNDFYKFVGKFAEGGTMNTIQQGDALIYKDSELLDFDNIIYVEDVSESAHGTIYTLSNGQSMFETQLKKKFRKANEGEINRSNIMSKEIFSKGGKTRRYMKKIKRGGITYGKSHAEGGIPVKNQSTGDMLEVEGGEGIVNKRSMASDKKVKLNGKEMTICEAVSQLNQLEGGVQFSCDDVEDRQFIEAMARGGELERGTRTEQEHIQVLKDLYAKRITPKQASERIAKDHLKEDSRYYSKLAKMERKMADGGGIGREETQENNFGVSYKLGDKFILNDVMSSKKGIETSISEILPSGLFFKVDKSSNTFSIKTLHSKGSSLTRGQYLIHLSKMAKGGEIFDKETEDLLSDLTKKYAKGGEVVADKTETINMKDFEGYADQYNGRKNKFFKANDEYQLLVNEGMELKNNTTLPQDEKDKLLAELREKAREAKTTLGEKRKDFVDMREVKSPFYAPQLADGGRMGKTPKERIDKGEGGTYKIKAKHPFFPSKGVDVYLNIDSQSLRGVMSFTIGTRNIDVLYPKEVIIDVLEKTGLKSSSFQVFVTKEAKSLKVSIHFNFIITSDNFSYLSMEILKALTSNKYYESILDKKKEIPTPPTEKEDDWNWRFKTEDELRAELGGDLHKLKDGNVFAISMRYLLGKKINETQEAVEAISKINQNTYGGVETLIQKQLGIQTPTKDFSESWNISSWMITNKPLAGEEVPPTEDKKYISVKEVEEELMRWTAEKVEEKKGLNSLKYQTPHLLRYILLNQARGKMSDFTQLIAMAKQSEKVNGEMVRLSNEGLPVDGFVMQLMYKKVLQLIEDIKAQIMLFVKYESDVKQELDRITFHIPYLAELDTFDKDYIINIK